MKKIISLCFILFVVIVKAQNTIPTTTVNGSLNVNSETRMLDTVRASKDIKVAGNAIIDGNIRGKKNLHIKKDITAKGEIISQDTLRAEKDILVGGNANIDGNLKVNNNVELKKGFTFDGVSGLNRIAPTTTTGEIFRLGNSAKPLPYFECSTPQSEPWNNFYYNGNFVTYFPAGSNTQSPLIDAALRIGMAPWNGNALIDVSGVDANGQGTNGLEINSFCKRPTLINTGWDLNPNTFVDGGTVFMGAKVDMQSSLKLGWTQSGAIDLNTSIEINQNATNGNGAKVQTWNSSVKAFSVFNTSNGINKNTFVVYGDGRTQIGAAQVMGTHSNAMLSVDGKITCRSLYVLKPTTWQDRVFSKEYSLQNLSDIDEYIHKNNHLPGVKSEKEVLENGYDINEMDATLLEKIENLYLYIIDQKKEIDLLKIKITELSTKNNLD